MICVFGFVCHLPCVVPVFIGEISWTWATKEEDCICLDLAMEDCFLEGTWMRSIPTVTHSCKKRDLRIF